MSKSKVPGAAARIRKASGELELFSPDKITRSLKRSGATDKTVERVLRQLRPVLVDGMTTRQLYKEAFRLLRRRERPAAARYSLRKAINQLGPTGYPFERFVARLLEAEGFEAQTGQQLQGKSTVWHEIDVVANDSKDVAASHANRILAECKYRRQPGNKCDVKVAMYVSARARDLLGDLDEARRQSKEFWLVTNAKFTSDARLFGESSGLRLISWDHPAGDGLKDRVERAGLHPLTCLTSLKRVHKDSLLEAGFVLARDLAGQEREEAMRDAGVDEAHVVSARAEVAALLQG